LNLVFRLVPRVVTALMIATAVRATSRPYSTAVAPDSSSKKFLSFSVVLSFLVSRSC
jgi:hypothetical protein